MTNEELEKLALTRHDEEVRRACLVTALNTVRLDHPEFIRETLTRAYAFYGFVTDARPAPVVFH